MTEFGAHRFDAEARSLYRGDTEIPLPPRVLFVLETLLERPGQIVSKEELLEAAWGGAFVGEDSLTQAISQLRQALGDDAQQPTYIQTIPRRGYRFIAVGPEPDRTARNGYMLAFGPFRLNREAGVVSRNGEEIALPAKALEVLECLLEEAGRTVSKDELLERVWSDTSVTDHSLIETIHLLRQAFDDDPRHPTYIKTMHRRGYRFIAAVEADGNVGPGELAAPAPATSSSWVPLSLLAAGLVVGALGVALLIGGAERPSSTGAEGAFHSHLVFPESALMHLTPIFLNMAISPDGNSLLYEGPTRQGLYVWRLDREDVPHVVARESVYTAAFSPDGDEIVYVTMDPDQRGRGSAGVNRLIRAPLDGGPRAELGRFTGGNLGVSWGSDGTIVYSTLDALWVLSPQAGALPVSISSESGDCYVWPHVLPGGKAIVAVARRRSDYDDPRVVAVSLETGEQHILAEGGGIAKYVDSGHLIIGRHEQLLAVPFDPQALTVQGVPTPVLDRVSSSTRDKDDLVFFDVSLNGRLLYVSTEFPFLIGGVQLVGRDGDVESLPVSLLDAQISPDGRALVGRREDDEFSDLYNYALGGGTSSPRLTIGRRAYAPLWSPDGQRLIFVEGRPGGRDLYWMPADGSDVPALLHDGEHDVWAESFSPDGELLAFVEIHPGTGEDIWLLDTETNRARPFLRTPYTESGATFSPDGRWIAYHSDESGRFEIYLRRIPENLETHDPGGPGYKVLVSRECGGFPFWARAGRELFFRSCDTRPDSFWAVPVATEPQIPVGAPQLLFEGGWERQRPRPPVSIAPDGRFVLVDRSQFAQRLEVVSNWSDELERLVPAPTGR